MEYYIIEVNPRLSRSSALASKATGYPIARVATKIALGYRLDEIRYGSTGRNLAASEPVADYVVLKIPRWPFDKFVGADKALGTRMKATGEVMAVGCGFEDALLKAVRSLELGIDHICLDYLTKEDTEQIVKRLENKTDERLFVVAEALRRGVPVDVISEKTSIDSYFINKIHGIIRFEKELKRTGIKGMTELCCSGQRKWDCRILPLPA